jgi:hypothetical protein
MLFHIRVYENNKPFYETFGTMARVKAIQDCFEGFMWQVTAREIFEEID